MPWTIADAESALLARELFGMRFGLDRMRRLLTALDHPERRFASIHVVGTNGKSSTTRMTAALLAGHGLRAGAYLSPHLRSFVERVQVQGADADDAAFAAAIERAARAATLVDRTLDPGDRVTQFELLTAAAYRLLADQGVEVAVVEAGLGGRYDATNVIPSRVQVLTNVGLEHTRWLGPTIADIAREKLAVTRPGATLAVGDVGDEAEAVVAEAVAANRLRLIRAAAQPPVEPAVLGAFQRRNFALACAAAEAFLAAGQDAGAGAPDAGGPAGRLDMEAIRRASRIAVPGRLERVGEGPTTLLDGAHNPAGIRAVVSSLPELLAGRPLIAVVSVLDDKDAAEMLRVLLPHSRGLVVTANSNPRALPPATLASLARQLTGAQAAVIPEPARALESAREMAREAGGVVLATGSIHLVGDLRDGGRGARRASAL